MKACHTSFSSEGKQRRQRVAAEMEELDDHEEEEVVVGQLPVVAVPKHIKKRALRNKALSVGFNDKELTDFVTGFHKRKKKRRKEAQRQLQEKVRLKRIEARKRRKQEREMAMYGRVLSSDGTVAASKPDAAVDSEEDNEDIVASVSETKLYEDNNTTVTVTTSAISHEDDDLRQPNVPSMVSSKAEKRRGLELKKKPLKKTVKHRSNKMGRKRAFGKKAKKNGRKK